MESFPKTMTLNRLLFAAILLFALLVALVFLQKRRLLPGEPLTVSAFLLGTAADILFGTTVVYSLLFRLRERFTPSPVNTSVKAAVKEN